MFKEVSDEQLPLLIRALNTERNLINQSKRGATNTILDKQIEEVSTMWEEAQVESENRNTSEDDILV